MQLTFKSTNLKQVDDFIQRLKITGAITNRARYRLSKLVEAKLVELDEDRLNLAHEYAVLDDAGNIQSNSQGTILFKNVDAKHAYMNAFAEIQKEDAVINVDEYKSQLQTFYTFLLGYNEELSGEDGFLFGLILDTLEDAGITEKEGN